MVLVNPTTYYIPSLLPDVFNGLPGIKLWFGATETDEIYFVCHLDSCAAMNTSNLLVQKWLMSRHPYSVAGHIHYDETSPFQPL